VCICRKNDAVIDFYELCIIETSGLVICISQRRVNSVSC